MEIYREQRIPSNEPNGVARQLNLEDGKGNQGEIAWSRLFTLNQVATTGMPLTFKPPSIIDGRPIVVLETPEVAKQTA